MRPQFPVVGPLAAASTNNAALSQAFVANTALNLNGALAVNGVVTFDKPRRVLFTNTGDNTAVTSLVLVGTNSSGLTITEKLAMTNGTAVASVLDYATLTSVTPNANGAGTVVVGTNGIAGSNWVRFDHWNLGSVIMQFVVSGTVNYTVQFSLDDPNSSTNPVTSDKVTWFNSNDTAVVGATGNQVSNFAFVPVLCRVVLNSGTGSVSGTVIQGGGNAS